MKRFSSRLALIDAVKAIASQLIVLHHLAYYGPMSDIAMQIAPDLISWLAEYGRLSVPAFLACGGFLAAQALAPHGILVSRNAIAVLIQRYLRLVVPYLLVLLFAVFAAAIARQLMNHETVPPSPTLPQLLAHVLLLQDLLDYDALSAGIWYVAIDFQLFSVLLALLWLARQRALTIHGRVALGTGLVLLCGVLSLFAINRDESWDAWALYFFGAYALGAFAYWCSARNRPPAAIALLVAVGVAALIVDFRSRIAIALAVAMLLASARRGALPRSWPQMRWIEFLGRISYSVFLVHYPVCLLVNAICTHFAPESSGLNALGMLVAWGLSIAAGACFHRNVECRFRNWMIRRASGARYASTARHRTVRSAGPAGHSGTHQTA